MISRRRGIAATAGLARPHHGLAEPRCSYRSLDRVILDGVSFTEEQIGLRIVRHGRRSAHGRIRCTSRSPGRCRRDDQHPVQTHGPLDGRVRAGLDEIGPRLQCETCCATADAPAQRCGRSGSYFGREGLHAVALLRRNAYPSQPRTGRITGDGPCERLGVRVIWAWCGGPLSQDTEAAT